MSTATSNKKTLSERDIWTKFITPAIVNVALKADNILDDTFKDETGSANQGNIGVTTIWNCSFQLPPLTEQPRIVAKVQQLQQQLSQLEPQVQQSMQYAQQLLQSVLREAFDGKGYKVEEEEEVRMVAEGKCKDLEEVKYL